MEELRNYVFRAENENSNQKDVRRTLDIEI